MTKPWSPKQAIVSGAPLTLEWLVQARGCLTWIAEVLHGARTDSHPPFLRSPRVVDDMRCGVFLRGRAYFVIRKRLMRFAGLSCLLHPLFAPSCSWLFMLSRGQRELHCVFEECT